MNEQDANVKLSDLPDLDLIAGRFRLLGVIAYIEARQVSDARDLAAHTKQLARVEAEMERREAEAAKAEAEATPPDTSPHRAASREHVAAEMARGNGHPQEASA